MSADIKTSSTGSRRKLLFVASLFSFSLLALPSLISLRQLPGDDITIHEQRRLHPFPTLGTSSDWLNFPKAFENYFGDRFGGRQTLTSVYRHLMIKWFGRSPVKKVLMADKGWLFLTGETGDAIDLYHRNVKPFSAEELTTIHEEIASRSEWVASWGGKSLFVLVPNKETIYPEQLPPLYQQQANPQSRYDQWSEIFANDPSLSNIDLRPILTAAKQKGLVYYRSDSHWNLDGAYIGYQAMGNVLQYWFPSVVPVDRPAATTGGDAFRGDLAKMLAVGDWFDEPDQDDYLNVQDDSLRKCAKSVSLPAGGLDVSEKSALSVFECNNPKLPTAVLVRDSMANRWLPLLPDNFRRLVVMYNWYPDAEVIAREKPDVVIFENVERSLHQYLLVRLTYDPVRKQARFVTHQ